MYDPHVTVFVREYRSQQVAVMGAVENPGLVSLTRRDATVLDAISEAGGMTAGARGRIYLMPAEERQEVDPDPLRNVLRKIRDGMPIMLDTKEVPQGVERFFFSLPVRGGDVIMIPNSGQFIVEGWVGRPGTYPLQPGLRLRGALATAGGLRFPANPKRVRIYRLTPNGDTEMQEVNYKDVVAQRAVDTFIHEGDVIEVASSAPKLVPYGVYRLVTDLIRVGARIPLIP
jgi:polysaccharide export outer membrane protein